MHLVDSWERVFVAGLELVRIETTVPPKNKRNAVEVHENVWRLLHPRPLTQMENEKVQAWALRIGAVFI